MEPKTKTTTIIPNVNRVLVRLQTARDSLPKDAQILLPGQLKAGDQLLYGEIVQAPEDSRFKKGAFVYYSEYSAAQLFRIGDVKAGKLTLGESHLEENILYVVAEDDIMAYEAPGDEIPVVHKQPPSTLYTK